ncbi:hypothetical protein GCM10009539_34520 [Cryptosporangium japonicum]|uniref:Uncharacterized protein n=1 Tax=Cryptosporangium japonicum TaxID=80872 RepID=A0ABN0UCR4_9ACTN
MQVHWRRRLRRALSAVESGLIAIAPFPGAPWPDLPAQGWVVGADGKPVVIATPMDGGPHWAGPPRQMTRS